MAARIGPSGFWSYVHKDDEQAGGRVLRLAERLVDEFALLTGEDLELFVDRDAIAWGDEWRLRIDVALQETTFFIPIVTPRYFTSEECRKELLKFSGHARSLGAEELLLPILFVHVAELDEDSSDEAKALIAKTQYADWRELRLTDEGSESYARAVNKLALRLAEISRAYSARPTLTPEEVATHRAGAQTDESDEPGIVDLMATVEEVIPQWVETLEGFSPPMMEISTLTHQATERIHRGDTQGKGFAYRVVVARDLAASIADSSQVLEELGERYAAQLVEMDPGLRALITLASDPDLDEDEKKSASELFDSIQGLVATSRKNASSVAGFVESLQGPARQFRDLRPALSQIQAGMRSVIDAQTILEEWDRLIVESRRN